MSVILAWAGNAFWIWNILIGVSMLPIIAWLAVWFLTNRKTLNSVMEDWVPLKETVAELKGAVGALQGTVSALQSAVSALQVTVGTLQGTVGVLQGSVNALVNNSRPRAGEFRDSKSPAVLSDKGVEVSDAIGAEALAVRYKVEVMKKIADDDCAYDVQEKCFNFARIELLEYLTDEEKARVKDYAFTKDKDLYSILWTVGVHMRDMILADRGYEPKQSDADNDSPHPPAG